MHECSNCSVCSVTTPRAMASVLHQPLPLPRETEIILPMYAKWMKPNPNLYKILRFPIWSTNTEIIFTKSQPEIPNYLKQIARVRFTPPMTGRKESKCFSEGHGQPRFPHTIRWTHLPIKLQPQTAKEQRLAPQPRQRGPLKPKSWQKIQFKFSTHPNSISKHPTLSVHSEETSVSFRRP